MQPTCRIVNSRQLPATSCLMRRCYALQAFLRTAAFALAWSILALLHNAALGGPADTNEFLARIQTNAAGHTLLYRLLLPKHYDPAQTYPVILYLHGAAGRGDDNAKPLDWGPLLFLESAVRDKYDFFLVVPQCPRSEGWMEAALGNPAGVKESETLRQALDLVAGVLPKEFRIDPKRRYLTGVSMGGHAVWTTLVRRPGFFAAAVPVCSGGDSNIVTRAAVKCPVWAFHSDDDHLVPVQMARDLVKAWRNQGGVAKYTEYTGLKHSSWKKAYAEPELFEWLFRQQLP
jgi:predicted peptidase